MDELITYVNALFTVFTLVILVRILLSFVTAVPVRSGPRAVFDFFHQSTDWFLNFFRRFIPPVGMFDLSPIVALIVLFIVNQLVVGLLDSFA
jgi:YggT family protein